MAFYLPDAPVPDYLRTDEFVLIPLRAAHNQLDYEAVMASQAVLRQGETGGWPRPGFTFEENLADLEEHESEFRERIGFTYSVQSPDETRCLGCVYIYPLAASLSRRGADEHAIVAFGERAASVWFWVRPDGLAAALDERLLGALLPWLRTEFAFAPSVILLWAFSDRQAALFQGAGLKPVWPAPEHGAKAIYFG